MRAAGLGSGTVSEAGIEGANLCGEPVDVHDIQHIRDQMHGKP